jgi:hypothetical protein
MPPQGPLIDGGDLRVVAVRSVPNLGCGCMQDPLPPSHALSLALDQKSEIRHASTEQHTMEGESIQKLPPLLMCQPLGKRQRQLSLSFRDVVRGLLTIGKLYRVQIGLVS